MIKERIGVWAEFVGRTMFLYGFLCFLYAIFVRFANLHISILDWLLGWMYFWGLLVGRILIAYLIFIGLFVFFVGREIGD